MLEPNAPAIDAARAFITCAAAEQEDTYLTHLQLHRLLYFAQGWSLEVRGRQLFLERLIATPDGPVAPSVWAHFESIQHPFPTEEPDRPAELDDADWRFVGSVWNAYRGLSAIGLRELIRRERPYRKARRRTGHVITMRSMREWFSEVREVGVGGSNSAATL